MTFPNYYSGINPNFLGGNPADFFTNPMRIDLGGMSTTTPTAGAPGNLNGVQQALQFFSNPVVQGLPEAVQIQFAANSGLFGNKNELDLKGMTEAYGKIQKDMQERTIEAEAKRAKDANEMARGNLVLGSLLKMPGQITDSFIRASTAGLPYQQQAREMMRDFGNNMQLSYNRLADRNTQFGNQINNLYSNAAAYRPTITPLAGKYFA